VCFSPGRGVACKAPQAEAWCAKLTEGVLIPQVYYDELLQGKTGRHDLKIQELKKK